jgi:hypothetical protein
VPLTVTPLIEYVEKVVDPLLYKLYIEDIDVVGNVVYVKLLALLVQDKFLTHQFLLSDLHYHRNLEVI